MGQVCFENFDFLVKVKGPTWLKPLFLLNFYFLFFYFFYFTGGLDPSQDEWVKSGWPKQTGQTVVGGDVIHDIIALEGVSTCGVHTRVRELSARVST